MNIIDRLEIKFVILSAFNTFRSDAENLKAHKVLQEKIKAQGLNFKEVQGVYKGIKELSLYVEYICIADLCFLKHQALINRQESILDVNEYRQARLLYINSCDITKLGKFKQVPKYGAISEGSYTYDSVNNGYYICE